MAYEPPSPGNLHAVLVDGYTPPASTSLHFIIGELATLYGAGDVAPPLEAVSGSAVGTLLASGAVEDLLGTISGDAISVVNLGAVVAPTAVVSAQGESEVEEIGCTVDFVEPLIKIRGSGDSFVSLGRVAEAITTINGSGFAQIVGYGRVYPQKDTVSGVTEHGENIGDGLVYQRARVSGSGETSIVGRGAVRQESVLSGEAETTLQSIGSGSIKQKPGVVSAVATTHMVVTGNGRVLDRIPQVQGGAHHLALCIGTVRDRVPIVSGRSIATRSFVYLQHATDTIAAGTVPPPGGSEALGFSRDPFVAAGAAPADVAPLEFER